MAIPEHVRLLEAGVEVWNSWRSDNTSTVADFSGADLRDVEAPGANLRYANLNRCDLRGANLDGAVVHRANADRANLQNASLRGTDLSEADLSRAQLHRVDATDSLFSRARMASVGLVEANLTRATFEGVVARDANCQRSLFLDANLTGADFRDGDFDRARIEGCSLVGASFHRAKLVGASLRTSDVSGASLRSANLDSVQLDGTILSATDLRKTIGLVCERLTVAIDWASAYRDEALACGASVPQVETMAESKELLRENPLPRWRDGVESQLATIRVQESRSALSDLEQGLLQYRDLLTQGMMGHNKPPEPLMSTDVVDRYIAETRAGIVLHDAPVPDKRLLSHVAQSLRNFRDWLQPRLDLAADAAATTVGTSVGVSIVGLGALIVAQITGALDSLSALLSLLM